jgi:tetratricopeptide (TPR) repeat protein
VPVEHSRILELRRRVQSDPASIAFAQLAEELRRTGSYDEAVDVCRTGLARHPGYLSARVTLGRTLIELGQLDEAAAALQTVIATASDNLAAIRGLAEIYQRRGALPDALAYFKRALELARHDPDLEETVDRIAQLVEPLPQPAGMVAPETVEELFDFDKLLEQLGVQSEPPVAPAAAAAELPREAANPADAVADPLAQPDAPKPEDPFAVLEQALREHEAMPVGGRAAAGAGAGDRGLPDLDRWLSAILADRA